MAFKNNYFVQKFCMVLDLSPEVGRLFKRAMGYVGVFELIKILPPVFFAKVIDALVVYTPESGISVQFVFVLLAGYLLSLLIMSYIEYLGVKRANFDIRDAEIDVVTRTLRKLLSLDITYHERNNTGASMNRLLKGQARLNELLWDFSTQLFPVFFQTIFTLIVLFVIGFEIGIAFLFFIPMFFIIIKRGVDETQKYRKAYYRYLDRFASVATQSVMNIRTVKDFSNEKKEEQKTDSLLKKFSDAFEKRINLGMKNHLTNDVLVNVARVTTLVLAVWLMLKGKISAGSLVLAMTLSEKAFTNLARIYRTYYRIQDAEPSIEKFNEIKDTPTRIKDNPRSKLTLKHGVISLKDVSFSYEGTAMLALRNVSFEIRRKQTVALVGKSGSGKSTLVKLLFRHFDPQKGEIRIDNRRLDTYSFKNLRKGMAVVSQDVELFNESILANIAYGVEKTTKRDVIKAAKMAYAHEFIVTLPEGYDTLVGERGVKLSGGQKQRIAIARALLRKPKILIFDEATSSLDAESEKYIHDAIFSLVGKLTLIIIAHRFSTIEHADKIILLEKGGVAEIGTHDQLVKKQGIFAKLRKLQKLGDVE